MEDLNLYLKDVLSERPHTRVPSADTVLRGYKGFDGYSPGVFTIGGLIVYLENRDGNANVRFKQAETHRRFFGMMRSFGIHVTLHRLTFRLGTLAQQIAHLRRGSLDIIFPQRF